MRKLLVALGIAALCGCTETAGTRVTVDVQTGVAQVLECAPRLRDRISVDKVTYSDVSGIARATVTISSHTHYRQDLQARMVWLDAEGTEVDPDGKAFRAITLDGKDFVTITGLAPRSGCVKAKVQIRETESAE